MYITATLEKTVNMGNYENAKPKASITADTEELEADDVFEAHEELRDMVRDFVEAECAEYRKSD